MLGFMGDAEAHHEPGESAGDDAAPGRVPTATFILRVRLDGQDSPSGSIGRPDAAPVTFNGWMDFMSTLNRLRAEASPRAWPGPT